MRLRIGILLLCAIVLSLSAVTVAQEITGDIRGVVRDASGAVVNGAAVTVTNTDRNAVIRALKTGSDGTYVAAYLPLGHYRVEVQAPGFRTYTAEGIVLNVSDHLTVDAKLAVGTAEQTVTVSESAVGVDLQTPTAAGVITGVQVRELAINTRNFAQLVALQPGVSTDLASDQLFVGPINPVTGGSSQMNFAINGNRPTQNNWMIDGVDNFDRGANLTLMAFPSVDAIAEFKVERANYLPEHGRSSGGEVNVITRGGTNQFHGSAYEFARNDVFNANSYFLKKSQIAGNLPNTPPKLRWNNFGFNLGGPIKKSKTFFFYSMEWRKVITYNTRSSLTLPTAAELQGNFPFAVCTAVDASGNCTASGTKITNINPVSAAYIKDVFSKIAAPNTSSQTLTYAAPTRFNERQEIVRIDHNFSSKFSVFGRYLDDSIPTEEATGLFNNFVPPIGSTHTNSPGRNASFHATWTINPTLLNDGGYGFTWGGIVSDPTGAILRKNSPDVNPTLAFGNVSPQIPSLDFCNFTDSACGTTVSGFGPYRDYNINHNFFDNLTWVRGNHSIKFGASYHRYTKDENPNAYGPSASGNFFFVDYVNGPLAPAAATDTYEQMWANFLMGNVYQFTQQNVDFRALIHQQEFEAYGQDEWRLRPNFTLNYGLRYSYFAAPTFGNGQLSTFDTASYDASKPAPLTSGGFFPAGYDPQTYTNGMIVGGKNSRFGDAVNPSQTALFAPRVGFAWDPTSTGKTSIRGGYGIFYDSPMVGYTETFVSGNVPIVQTRVLNAPNFANVTTGQTVFGDTALTVGGPNASYWKQPYSQMFNLDVQQQLSPSMMLDIGYFGNLGRHLLGVIDVNMPRIGDYQKVGIATPFTGGFSNIQKLNLVRPYKGYEAINEFTPAFTSNYNGLQVQFQKHFSENSMVVLNYTWSKNLTTASNDYRPPQYSYDLKAEYGPADIDRQHVFTGSYVYTLPFFRKQQGFIGHVLGGWEVSGIVYLNSGKHATASASCSANDRGGLGICSDTYSGARPDQVLPDPNSAPRTMTAPWFNKAAFAQVPAGQVRPGSEKRGTLVYPGLERWDANIYKNAKLSERFSLQFRAEAFNVLNHTNPSGFYSTNYTSSLFGVVSATRDPRQLQLALKLLF